MSIPTEDGKHRSLLAIWALWLAAVGRLWWRSRLDVTIDGGASAFTVTNSVSGGVYTIGVSGGPRAGTYEIKARWYDCPTTLAWKLRRRLRKAPIL